ncbi:hypothetical protein EV715DRAFT_196000 [Schizophyllum commune]
MDSLVDEDPELALEMVKLLGNELKSVKAQLRDVQSQRATSAASVPNPDAARTAAENAELRERLRELEAQIESDGSVKKEPYDEDDLLQQKEKIIQRQSEDLNKLYRDMQKLKKENERLLQVRRRCFCDRSVRALHAPQESASQQQVNIIQTADIRQRAQTLQADLASSNQREKALAAELKMPKEPYAPSKFLEKSRRAKNSKQPIVGKLKAFLQPEGAFSLRPVRAAIVHINRHNVMALNSNEVFWPTKPADEISRAVAIYPAHIDCIADRNVGDALDWMPPPIKANQTVELFHQGTADNWWLYMGTYVCRAIVPTTLPALPLSELKDVSHSDAVSESMASRALNKDLVAPVLFKTLKTMFRVGLLQVCCLEMECVGFNGALYGSLLGLNGAVGAAEEGANKEGPAKRAVTGRKRARKGNEGEAQGKKAKTN